jgi:hypothetical protein
MQTSCRAVPGGVGLPMTLDLAFRRRFGTRWPRPKPRCGWRGPGAGAGTTPVLALARVSTVAGIAGALEAGATMGGVRVEFDHLAPGPVGAQSGGHLGAGAGDWLAAAVRPSPPRRRPTGGQRPAHLGGEDDRDPPPAAVDVWAEAGAAWVSELRVVPTGRSVPRLARLPSDR